MSDTSQPGWNEAAARDPIASLCNIEAEQGLLGAIFVNNKAYEHVVDVLAPEDFVNAAHGRIFSAIGKLIATGSPANPITVLPVVREDEAIPPTYLTQLVASAVTVINAQHYAQQIADLSRRRDIIAAAQDTIADAVVVDPDRMADAVLDDAEERLYGIAERRAISTGPVALGTVVNETMQRIQDAYKAGGCVTTDTGLADLDRIISGMSPGDLVVVGGRPGMGKSVFAGSVAINTANAGKRVAIFSLEMSNAELTERWIAGMTGISTDRQRHGQIEADDWPNLIDAGKHLNTLGIMVDDQPRLSVPQIRQRARRLRRRRGLDLIIVDHLHLIRQGGKQENRRLEIGDASGMLKAVAKELKVPILLLAQLNRGVEQRDNKRPVLSDLRESGDIEQDADVVMFLYREEYYLTRMEPQRRPNQTAESYSKYLADWQDKCSAARNMAEVEVAKNRHGRTGMARVYFDGERQRFENLARDRYQ